MSDLKESKISPTFNNPLPEDVKTIKFIKETMFAPITKDEDIYFLIIDMVYRLILKGYNINLNEINYEKLVGYYSFKKPQVIISYFSHSKLSYNNILYLNNDYPYQITLLNEKARS